MLWRGEDESSHPNQMKEQTNPKQLPQGLSDKEEEGRAGKMRQRRLEQEQEASHRQ